MGSSTVFILCLILCIGGCIFCPYWIKTARNSKDKARGIFSLIMCIFMLIVSSWGIIYDNNLLWYGQQRENAHIEMKINTSNVEKTSFIYVLEKFDTTTTIEDVIALMGSDYVESNDNGYTMRYETSRYTLNGKQSSFISFTFNRRKPDFSHLLR